MKWGKIFRFGVIPLVILAIPIYLSTNGFMTWLFEKAYKDKWPSAPTITFKCAGYYRWTFREDRAVEVYKIFYERWPQHELMPEAVYLRACAMRDYAQELEYKAHGKLEIIEQKKALREEAADLFEWYALTYPEVPNADVARRAAQNIRAGF